MEPTGKLFWESPAGTAAEPHRPDPLANLVRLVQAPSDDPEAPRWPVPAALHPATDADWTGLIDRVRAAAGRVREAETQALAREQQMQELTRQARAQAEAAEARVRAAETRAREAEMRAEQAEARARAAEDWLMRVRETITSEFGEAGGEGGR